MAITQGVNAAIGAHKAFRAKFTHMPSQYAVGIQL